MRKQLTLDYLRRADIRYRSLSFFYEEADFADIIRLGQEVVELYLKGFLIMEGIRFPKSHDVGEQFLENSDKYPDLSSDQIKEIARISKEVRRDRENSFYGADDILPLSYYKQADADRMLLMIEYIRKGILPILQIKLANIKDEWDIEI